MSACPSGGRDAGGDREAGGKPEPRSTQAAPEEPPRRSEGREAPRFLHQARAGQRALGASLAKSVPEPGAQLGAVGSPVVQPSGERLRQEIRKLGRPVSKLN